MLISYVNGNFIPLHDAHINITDLSVTRGYGVFDFFRVIDGKPIFLEDYINRLFRSTASLYLDLPHTKQEMVDLIYQLIEKNTHSLMGIKIVVTGGNSEDGYTTSKPNVMMIAKPFRFHPYENGLYLKTLFHQRELHTVKSINYLVPIHFHHEIKRSGADDVLYYNNETITESSRSNIFIVKNGILITPHEGMLEGITRKRILQFADEIMSVELRNIALQELLEADEVFLTASTKRVSPVTRIDDVHFTTGKYTKQLYDRLIAEEGK